MHFRRLKFRKKDKESPVDNEQQDTISSPPTQSEATVESPEGKEDEDTTSSPSRQPEATVTPDLLPPTESGISMHAEPSPPQSQQLSSPIVGPLGPTMADNEEIRQIWAEIQEKVAKLARQGGRSVNTGMQIGDVMGTLESTEHPDVEPGKRAAVKKVFGNTLKVIQTVGGFVADGASQVRDTRPR